MFQTIFFLNYLIAIVSESFSEIIANEEIAVIVGRAAHNREHFRSTTDDDSDFEDNGNDIELILLSTVTGQNTSGEWGGIVMTIKKRFDVTEKKMHMENRKIISNMTSKIDQLENFIKK